MSNRPPRGRLESGELNYLDYCFARFLTELEATGLDYGMQNLIADLSHALTEQHSCIDLAARPDCDALVERLANLSCVGDGSRPTPLVLDDRKLFLHRYFSYETRVARDLVRRNRPVAADAGECRLAIENWFPADGNGIDWQQVAALQALTHQLTVITGGPGTGKTTTVVRILAMMLARGDPVIKLAAPTGKAAMRLSQSLNAALPDLPVEIREKMPDQVQTIHRLLGTRSDGRSSRYGRHHQIPVDILIVDETSMIDLAMMDRLLSAIPEHTKLLLLGDADQLPSVDTGNILADICRYPAGYSESFADFSREILGQELPRERVDHLLTDAVCHLRKNYRFASSAGIGRLARAVREGVTTVPAAGDEVLVHGLGSLREDMGGRLAATYTSYLDEVAKAADTETLIRAFDRNRVLSPVRDGPWGVEAINNAIETCLRSTGIVDPELRFYHGRPIIILRNDYNLGLFNGDTGITLYDPSDQQYKVAFTGIDGLTRLYLASRLPPHETCFAMTVHKSQGSEFEQVTLVLPDDLSDAGQRVLNRELLYTAVTRARRSIALYCDEDTFADGVSRKIVRHSGLGERFLPSR